MRPMRALPPSFGLRRCRSRRYGSCRGSGAGVVKTAESMSIEVIRTLALAVKNDHIRRVTIRVNDEVAAHLNNKKRREVMAMEDEGKMTVQILGSEALYPEHLEMDCRDDNGERVEIDSSL